MNARLGLASFRSTFRCVVLLSALIGAPQVAKGQTIPTQTTPQNSNGTLPYNTYGGVRENINLATGNLNLQIPLVTLPGRAGHNFTLGLEYDSNISDLQATFDPNTGTYFYTMENENRPWAIDNSWNWRLTIPSLQATIAQVGVNPKGNPTECYENFIATLADGSKHVFVNNKVHCWDLNTATGQYQLVTSADEQGPQLALDGSVLVLDTTNENDIVLHSKDGTVMHFNGTFVTGGTDYDATASKIEDTDGNVISISTASGLAITDTVGRQITYSGGVISYKDSNGTTRDVTLGFSSGLLSSITLPTGLKYSISDSSGLKVTYPTGGYTQYDFGTFTAFWNVGGGIPGQAEPYGEVTARHVCTLASGSCTSGEEFTTTYSPTINSSITSNEYMNVTDPLGNLTHYQFTYGGPSTANNNQFSPREILRQIYQGSSTLLKTIQTCYDSLSSCPTTSTTNASLPVRVTTTLNDSTPPQVKKVEYDYEAPTVSWYGGAMPTDNVADEYDYDYAANSPGGLLRHIQNTWIATNPVNGKDYTTMAIFIVNRKASETIYNGSGTKIASTTYEYDNYTSGITASGAVQHDSAFSTSYTTRGNLTATERWRNTDGATLTTRNQYDDAGNILSTTDPKNNITKFSYTDSWTNSTCAPSGGSAKAYVTSTTNALNQTTYHTYNSCSGSIATTKDVNSQTTTFSYDLMGRLTETAYPDGGQVTTTYNEGSYPLSVTATTKISSSQNKVDTTVLDGVGEVTETQLTSDPQGTDYADTTYDALGRVASVSNPYRSTSDPTYGLTSYTYDALNRTKQVTDADGSVASTVYSGSCTTVTDEQSKNRESCIDGLGRMTTVVENPGGLGYTTTYGYDALGNLISVVQNGSRSRSFVYNSLSELLTSTNPETGAITYTYDNDGNMATKKDARSITTTYSYDVLNRVSGMTYSNGDPSVSYTYDQSACLGQPSCYNIGHRTTMTDAGGTEYLSYDKMGRELAEQRTTNSVTKTTTYGYNLIGDIATLTYPSGRTITYTYDSAARPSDAVDTANGINYAVGSCSNGATSPSTGACYAPFGALSQVQNGTNLISTYIYNTRLQPCWMYATTGTALATSTTCTASDPGPGNILDLKYAFNLGTSDNGNVMGITNDRDSTRTQSFSYDPLNRIASAQTSSTSGSNCWGESYTLDAWANLTVIGGLSGYSGCTQENLSVAATTSNQLSSTGFSYDASGNMLTDAANTYAYNAESEIKSAAGVNYTYDGDGNRLEKSSGTIYWYGAGTEILDESDTSGNFTNEYVFFGGKRIAMRNVSSGAIYYYEDDMLGSSRTIVQAGQTSLCYDGDFYPFGGERIVANTCAQHYKFEGKERDTETGNDDFGARYYSSRFGRFMSADWSSVPVAVPYANLTNPQTLNLYAMVHDNPESFADLDGHGEYGGFHEGNEGDAPVPSGGSGADLEEWLMGQGVTSNGFTVFCVVGADGSITSFTSFSAAEQAAQQQNTLTPAEQNKVTALVCAEACTSSKAGQEAVTSAILNRANSGERQYVAHGKTVNVTNVVESGQFQGYSTSAKSVYQKALAGTLNNTPGFKSTQAAVADVLKNGVTTNATFIFNGKSPPSSGWFGRAVQNGTLVPATPAKVDDWYLYVPH